MIITAIFSDVPIFCLPLRLHLLDELLDGKPTVSHFYNNYSIFFWRPDFSDFYNTYQCQHVQKFPRIKRQQSSEVGISLLILGLIFSVCTGEALKYVMFDDVHKVFWDISKGIGSACQATAAMTERK